MKKIKLKFHWLKSGLAKLIGLTLCLCQAGCGEFGQSDDASDQAGNAVEEEAEPIIEIFPAQRAKADVCKLGSKLRQHSDAQKIITGAPGKLLDVKVGMILEIQVPQAIQFFKAEHGRFPKNHQEFLTMVCAPNNLQLPELVDGMVYQFDSERGELWVYPKDEVPPEQP